MLRVSSQAFHGAQSPGPGASQAEPEPCSPHPLPYRAATSGLRTPMVELFPLAGSATLDRPGPGQPVTPAGR